MNHKEEIIKVAGLPLNAQFNWSVGVLMEKFIKSLADKKLLASKCSECGYVTAPPRTRCVRCNIKMGEADLIELSGKGTLLGSTVAQVKLDGKCNFVDLGEPQVIAAIKLEGADSTIFMPLDAKDPEQLEIGTEVSIQWSDPTKGEIADIKCFAPA